MNEFIIKLKNGEEFNFTANSSFGEINKKLNNYKFIYFGPIIFNTSEILYIRQVESR